MILRLTPFEKWALWVLLGLLFGSALLRRVLPTRVWSPIETGLMMMGGAIATGATSDVNLGSQFSHPYPEQSMQHKLQHPTYPSSPHPNASEHRTLRITHRNHNNHPKRHQHRRSRRPRKHRFTKKQKELLASRQGWICPICTKALPEVEYTDVDHIHRFADYQIDWPNLDVLQCVHVECHRWKTRIENSKNPAKAYAELEHPKDMSPW